MSKELRDEILLLLEEHAGTGSPNYKGDKEIAERLSRPVGEIQRQMDILESQGLITSANSRDGNSARINPRGLLKVEELRESVGASILHAENVLSSRITFLPRSKRALSGSGATILTPPGWHF